MAKGNKEQKRQLAKELAREGKTADQIKETLVDKFGASYRRQELLKDIREAKGQPRERPVEQVQKYTPTKYKEAKYNEDLATRIRDYKKQYNHLVEYKLYNRSTKETTTEYITIATDQPPTKGTIRQVQEKAKALIEASLKWASRGTGSPTILAMMEAAEEERQERAAKKGREAKPLKKEIMSLKANSVKYLYTVKRLD